MGTRHTLPTNPFEYGGAIHPDTLVDRTDEVTQLVRAGARRERVFFIGPRRYGKTSILRAVERRLTEDGIVVLRHDAEKYESIDVLAQALVTGATRALTGPLDVAQGVLGRFFAALKPEATFNAMDQTLSVTLGTRVPSDASRMPLLTDALDGIDALAKDTGRRVVVILDEFQQVVAEGGMTAERQLRAVVQTHEHVGYIFAGSKTRLLIDMTQDHSRAFYKLGARLFLGPIPRDDFRAFLATGFLAGGVIADVAALDRILDVAEEVPYNVQRLAHACWDATVAQSKALTVPIVDATLRYVVVADDPAYTQLWLSLTTVQKKALKAVITEGGHHLLSKAVSQRHDVATPSLQRALTALDTRGIVRDEERLGTVDTRLEDPFLAVWLRVSQNL
jgi:hypothetical protein